MLNLAFLGVPEVRYQNESIIFPTRKTLALLIYLAVEGGLQSREKLTDLFWPNSDESRGRGSLRRAILQLRQHLRFDPGTPLYFNSEGDLLSLNLNKQVELDVRTLQNGFKLARSIDLTAGPAQIQQWIGQLQPLVKAYRGDFLEGFSIEDAPAFDNWVSLQRESCHRWICLVYERLSQLQLENGDVIGAVETATHWVRHDSLNETAYAYLMKLHLESGNSSAARQVYEACATMLEQEFGSTPSPQLEELFERLRQTPVNLAALGSQTNKVVPPAIQENTGQYRVLLVDDDPDMLDILSHQLRQLNYTVSTLDHPEKALNRLKDENYNLLITDAMMPGFSGYDLVKAVRTVPALNHLPIIMLTSLDSAEDALQAFRDGIDAFLTKPWKVEVLHSKIRQLLERDAFSKPKPETTFDLYSGRANSSGLVALDEALGGSWPAGANILVLGKWSSGKSTFANHFLTEGLLHGEPGLWLNFDDSQSRILHQLDLLTGGRLGNFQQQQKFALVEGAEWCNAPDPMLEQGRDWEILSGLAKAIMDAGSQLGQNVRQQAGGRRVLDSISSLFLQFDLPLVQRFLQQVARTGQNYGKVSTLFVIEQEAVDPNQLNQIKYFMDGILELRHEERYEMRVVNHRWQTHSPNWFEVKYYLD